MDKIINNMEHLEHILMSEQSSSDFENSRNRPYNGQPHTDQGERGKTLITGLTMRDVSDCYVKGYLKASGRGKCVDDGTWMYAMIYEEPPLGYDILDPRAVSQNMTCEIEKMMGIYPNVPKLKERNIHE